MPRVLDRIEAQSRLLATHLESYVERRSRRSARLSLRRGHRGLIHAHISDGLDTVDGVSEQTWRERIADAARSRDRRQTELRANSESSALTTTSASWSASIAPARTEQRGLSPTANCERKSDANLLPGDDSSGSRATSMFRPSNWPRDRAGPRALTFRRCASRRRCSGPDSRPFGIVIANVDMRPALDRVRIDPRTQEREIYVVESQWRLSRPP